MSREATATTRGKRPCAATASYTVQFRKRPRHRAQRQQEANVGRIPRVTRLLALAHKIDGFIRSGEIRDWAEAARLVGVTRARMTQIANLTLLAPRIQERILFLDGDEARGMQRFERDLRSILAIIDWKKQSRQYPT